MHIPAFRQFVPELLKLPCVASVHAAGLEMLRAAFGNAGFQVSRPVSSQLVAPGAPPAYWGGFEVVDPVSGAVVRVMASLGYTSRREPLSTAVGLLHKWKATPAKLHRDAMPVPERRQLTEELCAHRITMPRLAQLNEDQVTEYFRSGLSTTDFLATSDQATQFVSGVVNALAP